jgi:HD-like signal output (HDOD) protein
VLAKSWNLPPHLVRLTGHHHQAAEDPEPDDQKVPRCLILASWNLAISVGFGYLKNTEPVGLNELLATLGIDPASLEAMREEARNWVKE